jgi:hypothetical protein
MRRGRCCSIVSQEELNQFPWRGVRVVDGDALEMRFGESRRGFESPPLRFESLVLESDPLRGRFLVLGDRGGVGALIGLLIINRGARCRGNVGASRVCRQEFQFRLCSGAESIVECFGAENQALRSSAYIKHQLRSVQRTR